MCMYMYMCNMCMYMCMYMYMCVLRLLLSCLHSILWWGDGRGSRVLHAYLHGVNGLFPRSHGSLGRPLAAQECY